MKIALASDHAGYQLKEMAKGWLNEMGHDCVDFGCSDETMVDYPDFIIPATEAVARGEAERAIVFGGSGNGEAIAANKVPGIRAVLCHDVTTARLGRAHNDANVLSLGARITGTEVAKEIVTAWLNTEFDGGRHKQRLAKIRAYEDQMSGSKLTQ